MRIEAVMERLLHPPSIVALNIHNFIAFVFSCFRSLAGLSLLLFHYLAKPLSIYLTLVRFLRLLKATSTGLSKKVSLGKLSR